MPPDNAPLIYIEITYYLSLILVLFHSVYVILQAIIKDLRIL